MSLTRWFKEKWVDVKKLANLVVVRREKNVLATLLADHLKELVVRLLRLQKKCLTEKLLSSREQR